MANFAYQDEATTEMLDGKIVAMSPRPAVNHNIAIGNIYRIFGNFFEGKSCTVFYDGVDVFLTKKDRVVPDVLIVCNKDIIKKNGIHGMTGSPALLAVRFTAPVFWRTELLFFFKFIYVSRK